MEQVLIDDWLDTVSLFHRLTNRWLLILLKLLIEILFPRVQRRLRSKSHLFFFFDGDPAEVPPCCCLVPFLPCFKETWLVTRKAPRWWKEFDCVWHMPWVMAICIYIQGLMRHWLRVATKSWGSWQNSWNDMDILAGWIQDLWPFIAQQNEVCSGMTEILWWADMRWV